MPLLRRGTKRTRRREEDPAGLGGEDVGDAHLSSIELQPELAEPIRRAIDAAVEAAEERATEEVLALEEDLEKARLEAEEFGELRQHLQEVERELQSARAETEAAVAQAEAARVEAEEARSDAERLEAQLEELLAEHPAAVDAAVMSRIRAEERERVVAQMEHLVKETASDRRLEPAASDQPVSLAAATFEDLRAVGMSVTQAQRVLNFRERKLLSSVEDLDQVPGFPATLRKELRGRLRD